MLQLRHLKKEYRTGDLVQKALDDVSLDLRDNEFVSILGPSGSGKSTLLNIIGGLDQYDSGDLIIDGVSTKDYTDRDWDSYRNHTIGFIFQSYNLIPHQTVLSNVELALTISGVTSADRRQRAIDALTKVGLGDQINKKPTQMSGGQMQRVAIARALVNDPKILLADEPTGALDTENSLQIMDLLKEVAKDRLVVMVTHNPELAQQYSTRIVRLRDGKITDDSDPLTAQEKAALSVQTVSRNLGKASMSFRTALSLSYNNLLTKKARTLMVSFAASIGIIGIALIMSLSNGMNIYIRNTERVTLSEYPLQIMQTAFNLSDLLNGDRIMTEVQAPEGTVYERDVIGDMVSDVNTNDLAVLKRYFDEDPDNIRQYTTSIEYLYNVTPQIYLVKDDGDYVQVNPDTTLEDAGISITSSIYTQLSSSLNVFSAMPQDETLYVDQYTVKAGRWPENPEEAVLVLDAHGYVTDLTLYNLGMKDHDELERILKEYITNVDVDAQSGKKEYTYDDFLGLSFKRVNIADMYTYDADNGVWVDRSEDPGYMRSVIARSNDLRIVGVVQPLSDTSINMLLPGICYPASLKQMVMEEAYDSEPVKAQLADPERNIFTGNTFAEDDSATGVDLSQMVTIDEDMMASAFGVDESKISVDMSRYLTADQLSSSLPGLTREQVDGLIRSSMKQVSGEQLNAIFTEVMNSYLQYAAADPATDYANLNNGIRQYLASDQVQDLIRQYLQDNAADLDFDALQQQTTDLLRQIIEGYQVYVTEHPGTTLEEYMNSEAVQGLIRGYVASIVAQINLTDEQIKELTKKLADGYAPYAQEHGLPDPAKLPESFQAYLNTTEGKAETEKVVSELIDMDALTKGIQDIQGQYADIIARQVTAAVSAGMADAGHQMANAMTVDTDRLAASFNVNIDKSLLSSYFSNMLGGNTPTLQNNLAELGYADPEEPSEIDIYPSDFQAKEDIKKILDQYNQRLIDQGKGDDIVTYTDMVASLMSSVTNIVNSISYVLIAFVAISLVVSSIMIGVITYISVLERRKEIGILRAIGASKRNISDVFNAETFLIGLLAGIMGVIAAWILTFPLNTVLHRVTGYRELNAVLPWDKAAMLVALSVVLTLLGGMIPARKAANSNPVEALRSE